MPQEHTLLIKEGTVVTATDEYQADVFVVDEKIHTIGKNLKVDAKQTLDATGCYLLPGGIDSHTHMELPFMGTFASDTFETGTLAGLHGGTTTIVDFVIQTKGDTLGSALNQWHEKAGGHAVGDYGFHIAVTDFNEKTKAEIRDLIEKKGVPSFKAFMAYKGALMVDDQQLFYLMKEITKWGGLLSVHAENGDVIDVLVKESRAKGECSPRYHALTRPPLCEAEASGRIIDLAYQAGAPIYIVHMTRWATQRNQKALAETCVQYLLLDDSVYSKEGFEGAKYVMSPPLRKKKDQEALWQGINQNLISAVTTDHCPFMMKQKEMGKEDFSKIPNGAPGIEHRVELLYSEGVEKGRITRNKWVEMIATGPAKTFGLFPRKGTIAVGSDADIVLFDPKKEQTISAKTHHMNCDYSAYEGWKVKGKCRTTLLRGTVAVEEGVAKIGKGFGQYLPRNKFNPTH